ncbi:hypothetical protein F2Q69_00018682 [Brassica cretica]|uniref:Transmembrane 9 superfamily member n=1 Tax=Brassica cretica TaxID=69181 RepID=A0A8S9QLN8_BRACR|nr:hypothetical protein F2Q69_00018682 [Brassica cretica]
MAMDFRRSAIAFTLLLFIHVAHSFYLPGVAPQDFEKGDELKVKVNKLTSIKTQLPYSYYSLPFCQPKKIVDSTENLGEVLRGDRIENAPYSFKMREAKMCNVLCRVTLDDKTAKAFKEKIDDEYRVNMILDNLPLVVPIERGDQGSPPVVYQLGYHVGLKGQYEGSKEQKYFMHNHLAFTVRYHLDMQTDSARIVGFEVKPYSVKHEYDGEWSEKARLTTLGTVMAMDFRRSAIAFTLLLSFIHVAHSFYLPGVAPQDFEKGDELKVKVNKLTSIKTQLPYSYYSLPFCQPKKIVDSTENLGEVLRGDRIENAPYSFKMREAKMCNVLCRVTLDVKTAKAFKEKIDDEYRVNMILDNLPLVVPIERGDQGSPPVVYQLGYHVGLKGQYEGSKEQKYFMHNHLAFTVRYHLDMQTDSARIVGFEVKPYRSVTSNTNIVKKKSSLNLASKYFA